MRLLLQRVSQAEVKVEGAVVGRIGQGLLVLAGFGKGDRAEIAERLLDKLLAYRVFSDSSGKMNLSLTQTGGGLLLVSQFTLLAETRKGLRPDFGPAMPPAEARQLFEHLVQTAQRKHPVVASGVFGADMQVSLVNDGPVTILLED